MRKGTVYYDKNGQPGDMPCDHEGNRLHSAIADQIARRGKPTPPRPPGGKKK